MEWMGDKKCYYRTGGSIISMFRFIHSINLLQNTSVESIQKFCELYPVRLHILDNGNMVLVYEEEI